MKLQREGPPCIQYGVDGATFARVCAKCSRYVRADKVVRFSGLIGQPDRPNATCKHCGRTEMLFIGYV